MLYGDYNMKRTSILVLAALFAAPILAQTGVALAATDTPAMNEPAKASAKHVKRVHAKHARHVRHIEKRSAA